MIDPSASDWAAGQPADDGAPPTKTEDLAAELARVRERLSFYESFDTLIRDNVLRSGELLREVAAQREQTDRKLLAMRAEVDRRLAEQRSALEEIAEGLSGLQSSLGTLADRVSGSLSALPAAGSMSLPEAVDTGIDPPDRGTALVEASAGVVAGEGVAPSPPDPAATGGAPEDGLRMPDLRVDPMPAPAIAATAQVAEPAATPDETPSGEPESEPAVRATALEDEGPIRRKIDLIVHGVPRAATALSLQRHLQELTGVEAVEVREYVSGVLRFQVLAAALRPEDFRRWQGGDGLVVVTARDNVLELKLPSAESF